MKRIPKAGIVLAGLLILAAAAPAFGQADERLVKLAEKMKADLEAGISMHMAMDMDIDINNGQMNQEMSMEMWQDGDSMRVEMPIMNMIIIATPEELYVYQGMAGVSLYAPPETMAEITDQRNEVFKKLGLPTDQNEMFIALIEQGAIEITGEETVDGHDCYIVEVDMTMMEAMKEISKTFMPMGGGEGMLEAIEFTGFTLALDQEEGFPRKMDMEMAIALNPQNPDLKMALAIAMKMSTIETGIDIPGELFEFEVPDDGTVVTWTKDKTAEQIGQEFQMAIMQGMQAGAAAGAEE